MNIEKQSVIDKVNALIYVNYANDSPKKSESIKKIKHLINKEGFNWVDAAEGLFEDYVRKHPKDIDMWIRFAVFELQPPLCDYTKTAELLDQVFKLDPNNFEALLLLAFINHYHAPVLDYNYMIEALSSYKTNDFEKLSMLEYAKSWSYQIIEEDIYKKLHRDLDSFYSSSENYTQYESALKKSIELYPYHVFNFWGLADLYNEIDNKDKAVKLIKKAMENVKVVYKPGEGLDGDWTSPEEYFNENIKGTHISKSIYKFLNDDLKEYSQS